MICLICNKDFNSVSSHIRVHNITAREYKMEFDIPLMTPLLEEWVHKARSEATKKRTPKERIERMRKLGTQKIKGSKTGKKVMPECSWKKLREGQKEKVAETCKTRFFKQRASLVEDHNKGATFPELEVKHKVSWKTLVKYLGKSNANGAKGYTNHDPKVRASVLNDYNKNMSIRDICIKHNLLISTTRSWITRRRASSSVKQQTEVTK